MFLIYLYVFLNHRKPFPIPINVIYTDVAKLDKYIYIYISLSFPFHKFGILRVWILGRALKIEWKATNLGAILRDHFPPFDAGGNKLERAERVEIKLENGKLSARAKIKGGRASDGNQLPDHIPDPPDLYIHFLPNLTVYLWPIFETIHNFYIYRYTNELIIIVKFNISKFNKRTI